MEIMPTSSKMTGFNTQPPEGGWMVRLGMVKTVVVSTHSRPKAAGGHDAQDVPRLAGFNTQPPEGGWG